MPAQSLQFGDRLDFEKEWVQKNPLEATLFLPGYRLAH
jgi:hypothetical protein